MIIAVAIKQFWRQKQHKPNTNQQKPTANVVCFVVGVVVVVVVLYSKMCKIVRWLYCTLTNAQITLNKTDKHQKTTKTQQPTNLKVELKAQVNVKVVSVKSTS